MADPIKEAETYTDAETAARAEATLKRMLATPHRPHKERRERAEARPRSQ
jgi:hypothetical protein